MIQTNRNLVLFVHLSFSYAYNCFYSGYMAPEYAIRGFISVKSDVFSFGVLMLEIISGRKNFDRQLDTESRELLKLVSTLNIAHIMDLKMCLISFCFHFFICVRQED